MASASATFQEFSSETAAAAAAADRLAFDSQVTFPEASLLM
ncbi:MULTISPECIES: hypothetical protein [Streptomyces]|nr:hypothetical protein [Streptomyces sp. WI03-4A]MDX2597385.1 hypothetical protein [Streptomyces sp. WI03-4A]